MDISVLREFSYLSRDLNFTKAAERLYISQSVLSRHIQALESEVGCKLFVRDKAGVRLTDAGASFASSAKAIVDTYEDAVMQLRSLEDGFTDIVRVGYVAYLADLLIDKAYEIALQRHPSVDIRFIDSWEARIASLLAQDKIDVAIMAVFNEPIAPGYASVMLFEGGYDVLVPPNDRLAQFDRISLDMLSGRKLLIPSAHDNPSQYRCIVEVLAEHPDIAYRDAIRDKHDNAALTNAGHGLALVSRFQAASLKTGDAKAIPVDDDLLHHRVCAVWKKDREAPAIRGFVDVLCDVAFAERAAGGTMRI